MYNKKNNKMRTREKRKESGQKPTQKSRQNNNAKKTRKATLKGPISKGGNVIGRGGYGCVFMPSLKCKDKKHRDKNKVSKLMKIKYVENEYKEIKKFKEILKKVPNYKKYYILDDIDYCKPDKLTEKDLDNFNETCVPLLKMGITKETVNDNLYKLYSLNIPNGGIPVDKYITKMSLRIENINSFLVGLLTNGILPMNKLDVYHNDIKESNILIDLHDNCRLIDWGISVKTSGNSVPKNMKDRPFQYNSPFSTILWNEDFDEMYKKFLENFTGELTFYDVREFLKLYINFWNIKRGSGHLETIFNIISIVQEHEGDEMHIILNYLATIVFSYTKNKTIILLDYFKNIYLKNVDIWGFVMTYSIVLEKMDKSNPETNKTYSLICYIIRKYLFSTPVKVINIDELTEDLNKI